MKHICYIIGAFHGEDACIRPTEDDFVIAADGGYAALKALGVKANLVVGDFDSLGYVPEQEEILRHPVRKDDTDTLLAIRLGLERGYKDFVITGSIGGRLDHTIANMQCLLFLQEHGARALLYGENTAVTAVHNGGITLRGQGTLSVFSMDPEAHGVTLRGLDYPVERVELTSRFPIGVSNAFLEGPADISVEDGTLMVIWQAPKEQLPDLIARL